MRIVYTTKCYERDWRILRDEEYQRKLASNRRPFDEHWMVINNVTEPTVVRQAFEKLAMKVFLVDDYAREALKFFKLTKEDFGQAYPYSITELVELYLAKDFDYLVHFSSDARMDPPSDWVTPGLELLQGDIAVVSPAHRNLGGKVVKDQLFTDHAYLVRVKEWRKPIFDFGQNLSEYPLPNLFEERAARYLRHSGRYRAVLGFQTYLHPSYNFNWQRDY